MKRETPDGPWVIGTDPYGGPFLWPIWVVGFLVFGVAAVATLPFWGPVVLVMYMLKQREAPVPAKDTPRSRWDGGVTSDGYDVLHEANRIALAAERRQQGTKPRDMWLS